MSTPRPIVRVITHRAIRHRVAVKFVWWYLTTHFDLAQPRTIKVRPTAVHLGLKYRTMRRALRLLVQYRYLDVIVPPTGGTPGEYIAGPRAYRLPVGAIPVPTPRRATRGTRAHPDQLNAFEAFA